MLLSYEDAETHGAIPGNLAAYATAGGHVFAEHFQYAWFNATPFSTQSIATWSMGTSLIPDTVSADPSRSLDGPWLAQWLPTPRVAVPFFADVSGQSRTNRLSPRVDER